MMMRSSCVLCINLKSIYGRDGGGNGEQHASSCKTSLGLNTLHFLHVTTTYIMLSEDETVPICSNKAGVKEGFGRGELFCLVTRPTFTSHE